MTKRDGALYIIAACLILIVFAMSFLAIVSSYERTYKGAFLAGCQRGGKVSYEHCKTVYKETFEND